MKIEKIILISLPVIAAIILLLLTDVGLSLFDERQSAVHQQNNAEAEQAHNEALEAGFDNYDYIYQEEFSAFKDKVQKQWGEFKSSSETEWVSYVDQGKVRRSVDYETGEISVELLIKDGISSQDTERILAKEVFTLMNTTEAGAFRADEVAQKVEARLPSDFRTIKRGLPSGKRIFSLDDLTSITFNASGFVKVSTKIGNLATNDVRQAKVLGSNIIRSSFTIKKSLLQKAARFATAVRISSERQKIPTALIYAIIESESSFNPMAKSHIPAYGLMQIVPRSAGQDATKHLYGKAKILAPSYLYSTDNNINIGSAYLHVLYYKYLRKVKDPQSRIYCTIAAYNTGATNVARAFIKKKHFNLAVKEINKMTSDEVYQALVNHLPFKETRNYVKKVSDRMEKYL